MLFIKSFKIFESIKSVHANSKWLKNNTDEPIITKENIYSDRLSGEEDLILNFYKSEYLADEKAIIAAYFIVVSNEKSIEVMNIKEFASETARYIGGSIPYSVTFHKTILPKSQIEILSEVQDKPGFFYIKIPYWLFQSKKTDLSIKRVIGEKCIDVRDSHFSDKKFMNFFKDASVLKYLSISDENPDTIRKANIYSKRI